MAILKVNGKEYKIKATYGKFKEIGKVHDFNNIDKYTMQEANDMFIDCYWLFLVRRWYGLKPFITKKNFENNVTMQDMLEMTKGLTVLLNGEDKQSKNSV